MTKALADNFDLAHLSPEFLDDPYPTYRALQAFAPSKQMANGQYFLTRHADLSAIYRDVETYSSDKTVEFLPKYGHSPLYEHHTTSLVFNDPPLHSRVRRLISGALTPRAISGMEPELRALVDRLLDNMGSSSADLIGQFAAAIPIEVIGNLLGVPLDEREPLRDWSLAILGALEPVLTAEQAEAGNTAVTEFVAYLRTLVERRRQAPGDPARDVLTRLIQGENGGEAGGERLSEAELLHNCIFLLNAGHETTTNLIGNALVLLHDHPDQRERLLASPELLRTCVEEVLRLESSNQLGNRATTVPVTLHGVELPVGAQLTLCIGAANRDPAQFADPDRFDIARSPNRHLAFAAGPHQCVGMSLARLEGAVAYLEPDRAFSRLSPAQRAGTRWPRPVPRLRPHRLRSSRRLNLMESTNMNPSLSRRSALAGVAAASLPSIVRAQPSDPVRIGVLTDASGPYGSSGGVGSTLAARMAVADFGPTVLGKGIEVIQGDTQNKPDNASAIARKWCDEGVDVITDLPVTPVALAVQQVAKEKGRAVMITAAAVSEFTSKLCSPISSHWTDDTHAMAAASGQVLTGMGGTSWFFITVDFSFGHALQAEATQVIEYAGGKVLGTAKFPIGNTDFSSQLLRAQTSGAKVIGLAAVGGDQVNLIKQAAEFGMATNGKQVMAGFLVYITDIHALGLSTAQGLSFGSCFYWDANAGTRAYAKHFLAERGAVPTKNQAAIYSATLHYLKAMAKAGTREAVAVNQAMRAMPVDWFGDTVTLREDGRLLAPVTTYRVKAPGDSKAPFDYYQALGRIGPDQAFLPRSPACATS